jgi:serine/threonine-protein kinase
MTLDWQRVSAEFAALVELGATGRRAHLEALATRDPALAAELASLLDASDAVGDRFEQSPLWEATADARIVGQRFGVWRVDREIGRGGMGTVYLAHRDDEAFTMEVALKVAAAAPFSDEAARRFRTERELLAGLQHRNIAALLDAGVTDTGLPWFVMERVDGVPITEYCDRERLGIPERIALFRQVCGAVHHAHRHLVIHRDLKPRNILVDREGTVKLLDFGIAKAIASGDDDDPDRTRTGMSPLTPAYAAPEQFRGRAVTTASDVYALGVVLYELLAGARPHGGDLGDRLRDDTPIRPPSRVATAESARRALRGDLDAIVLRAMHSDPDRRYATALELGLDLQRALQGRPVDARPDTLGYRTRTFVRRNRLLVATGALATAAMLTGTVVALRLAHRANQERDRALLEAERTRGVTQFFRDVLAAASPEELGPEATVLQALDHAIPRIDSGFAGNPDLRAAIKNSVGATLLNLYLPERARPLSEDALRTLDSLGAHASPRERADALYNLAGVEATEGALDRSDSLYRAAIAAYWAVPGIDSTEVWLGISQHAGVVSGLGRLEEAVAMYTGAVEGLARRAPHDSVDRSVAETNLATALAQLGRYAAAEPRFRRAIALLGDGAGSKRFRVAAALQPWAGTLNFLGRGAEAEAVARRSYLMNRELFGAAALPTAVSLRMLINVLADGGRCPEAIAAADEMIAMRRALPDGDPSVGTALMYSGWCRARIGDAIRGEALAREALALRESQFPAGHWAIAQAQAVLGDVLAHGSDSDRDEALALLQIGYDGLAAQLDSGNVRVKQAREWLEAATRNR